MITKPARRENVVVTISLSNNFLVGNLKKNLFVNYGEIPNNSIMTTTSLQLCLYCNHTYNVKKFKKVPYILRTSGDMLIYIRKA